MGSNEKNLMLEAKYRIASLNGYNGPKTESALNAFANSSPGISKKFNAIGAALAKGGVVKGYSKGGGVTAGTDESGNRVWMYGGTSYSDISEALSAAQAANPPNDGGAFWQSYSPPKETDNLADTRYVAGLTTFGPDSVVDRAQTKNLLPYGTWLRTQGLAPGEANKDSQKWSKLYADYVRTTEAQGVYDPTKGLPSIPSAPEGATVDYASIGAEDADYRAKLDLYNAYNESQAKQITGDPEASLLAAKKDFADQNTILAKYNRDLANMEADDPNRGQLERLIAEQNKKVQQARQAMDTAQTAKSLLVPTQLQKATADYMSMTPQAAEVGGVDKVTGTAAQIASTTGQLTGPVGQVTAAQAGTAQADTPTVQGAATYDPTKVSDQIAAELAGVQAEQGTVTEAATVRGQMALLMQDFDEGTPPWASGAMRAAMQTMAARGLGASSMAGQAIVQAAMESALPIASQDAKTNAEMLFKNLDNRQQTMIFKTQQRISGLLSDQAAENAAKNFNAQSENQVNMFKSNLEAQVAQFNTAQVNAIAQFNAGEENVIAKFNQEMQEQRAQFNAKNDFLVQQANTQFRNDMFQAQMRVNADIDMQKQALNAQIKMDNARIAAAASEAQLAREQQSERDALERAFVQEENAKNRALTLLTSNMSAEVQREIAQMQAAESAADRKAQSQAGFGKLIGMALGAL